MIGKPVPVPHSSNTYSLIPLNLTKGFHMAHISFCCVPEMNAGSCSEAHPFNLHHSWSKALLDVRSAVPSQPVFVLGRHCSCAQWEPQGLPKDLGRKAGNGKGLFLHRLISFSKAVSEVQGGGHFPERSNRTVTGIYISFPENVEFNLPSEIMNLYKSRKIK